MTHPLHALIDSVEAHAGGTPTVVFDVDSTLIDTAPRHLAILRDFVAHHDHPSLEALAARCTPADFDYDVTDPLVAAGIDDPALHEALMAWWWPRFFSDAFCRDDVAYPHAVAFVRGLVERGARVAYVTARLAADMGEGTIAAFLRLGLPVLDGRTALILRQDRADRDVVFKRNAVASVRSLGGPVLATFENEPANANAFAEAFPEAMHLLLDTHHGPGAPALDPRVQRLASFELPPR